MACDEDVKARSSVNQRVLAIVYNTTYYSRLAPTGEMCQGQLARLGCLVAKSSLDKACRASPDTGSVMGSCKQLVTAKNWSMLDSDCDFPPFAVYLHAWQDDPFTA